MVDQGQEGAEPRRESDSGESQESGIGPAVEQVESFVASDPSSSGLLERVLEQHLSSPPNEDSFKEVRDAGVLVMGEAAFGLVVWIASKSNRAEAIDVAELSPKARSWVTGIVALYGDRLKEALHASDVLASRRDDWEGFGSRVLVDPRSGEYEVTIEIQKFNGEKLVIEAGVTSVARLAERTLSTLASIDNLSSLEDDDREDLLKALGAVRDKLETEPPNPDG